MPVAVKIVRSMVLDVTQAQMELEREAAMLQTLRHAHIVQFYGTGVCGGPDSDKFIVMELMELGSLRSLLQHQQLDWITKLTFAREVASGMALVHSLHRLHRDLKSGNILVTNVRGCMLAKVADFGTSTLVMGATMDVDAIDMGVHTRDNLGRHTQQAALASNTSSNGGSGFASGARTLTRGVGTPLWMAPEIIAGRKYGYSADVWSFAIVLWELASQEEPWTDIQSSSVFSLALLEAIEDGRRPPISADWPQGYVDLMMQGWQYDPAARPPFETILDTLKKLMYIHSEAEPTPGSSDLVSASNAPGVQSNTLLVHKRNYRDGGNTGMVGGRAASAPHGQRMPKNDQQPGDPSESTPLLNFI